MTQGHLAPGYPYRVRRHALAALCICAALLGGCVTSMPGAGYAKEVSVALPDRDRTALGRHFDTVSAAHEGRSGFRLITRGVDGFLARVQLIDAAQATLDLQYFIFRSDQTGTLLADALRRAAQRGVRVRLLVDDGDTVEGDERLLALADLPSVEIRIFNPFRYRGHNIVRRALEFLPNRGRLDYRMHNKLIVIDNSVALVGGRNIGDQYFQVDPGSQFADGDVVAVGPVVRELSNSFDTYWNSNLAVPTRALGVPRRDDERHEFHRRTRPRTIVASGGPNGPDYVTEIASGEPYEGLLAGRLALTWATAVVICDSPDKRAVEASGDDQAGLASEVLRRAALARNEVLVITPYLVPAADELAAIRELRGRDVRVRMLTSSLEAATGVTAHAGYMNFRRPLLNVGVELYEVRARPDLARGSGQPERLSRYGHFGLHAKLVVFDRDAVFIGSMNLDQRSKQLNTELGVIIESPELAAQSAERFAAMTALDNAYRVTLVADGQGRMRMVWDTIEAGQAREYHHEPGTSLWTRLRASVMALLPIDGEL